MPHFPEGMSQRRPASTRVQEDLRRPEQIAGGLPLPRDDLLLLRHKPGEGLLTLPARDQVHGVVCVTLPGLSTGQHAGLHRVRRRPKLDLERKSGRSSQMVLQDVRPGWEWKVGPERGEAPHKGEENLLYPKVIDRNV